MKITDYITTLTINKLKGRLLRMPGPTPDAQEVLFIYGHHASLERWWGVMQLLNQRCAVTMPDLPGFGGMQSLYKQGKPATLDNIADWLADFMRTYYKGRQVRVIGMSLGFVVVTRMLQRHPDLCKNVGMLVSLFGFAHKDDFLLPAKRRNTYLRGAKFFSAPLTSHFYRALLLNPAVLRRAYHKTPNAKEKFKGLTSEQHKANMDFEINLWRQEDLRTYMKTTAEFLTLDNTKTKVGLPVYHVAVAADRYFNNRSVEKHFKQIFTRYTLLAELKKGSHAPTFIATVEGAREIIPDELLTAVAGPSAK